MLFNILCLSGYSSKLIKLNLAIFLFLTILLLFDILIYAKEGASVTYSVLLFTRMQQ